MMQIEWIGWLNVIEVTWIVWAPDLIWAEPFGPIRRASRPTHALRAPSIRVTPPIFCTTPPTFHATPWCTRWYLFWHFTSSLLVPNMSGWGQNWEKLRLAISRLISEPMQDFKLITYFRKSVHFKNAKKWFIFFKGKSNIFKEELYPKGQVRRLPILQFLTLPVKVLPQAQIPRPQPQSSLNHSTRASNNNSQSFVNLVTSPSHNGFSKSMGPNPNP